MSWADFRQLGRGWTLFSQGSDRVTVSQLPKLVVSKFYPKCRASNATASARVSVQQTEISRVNNKSSTIQFLTGTSQCRQYTKDTRPINIHRSWSSLTMDQTKSEAFNDIIYEVKDGVATITLNRPRVKNAFSKRLSTELILALRLAVADDNVVVCVITGAGDFFSSGNDLKNLLEAKKGGMTSAEYMTMENEPLLKVYGETLINFPKSLIAAVNGPAIGMGVTTLGLVDVVYASDTATFLTPFTALGITPEVCSSFTFPRIMGYSRAHEMLYFGKKLSAHEAKTCGLVSDVFPVDTFQRDIQSRVKKFAAMPRKTLLAAKKLCRDDERHILTDVLHKEMEVLAEAYEKEESKLAVQKFFERKSKM